MITMKKVVRPAPGRRQVATVMAVCALTLVAGYPATARGKSPVRLDNPDGTFQVHVPKVQGVCEIPNPLCVEVDAGLSGWNLFLHCPALHKRGSGRAIPSGDILLLTDGDPLPLTSFCEFPSAGEAGSQVVEVPLAVRLDPKLEKGTYCGHLLIQARAGRRSLTQTLRIPFELILESGDGPLQIEAEISCRDNKIYFHWGSLPGVMSASVTGRVSTDGAMRLTLIREDGRVDLAPMRHHVLSSRSPEGTLELQWELRQGEGEFRLPDRCTRSGDKIGWDLYGTPGDVDYEIRCTAAPSPSQPPGDYALALRLGLEPVL